MQRSEASGAERPVLLLRMLQDQERDAAVDRFNAVADAQGLRLAAGRALGDRVGGKAHLIPPGRRPAPDQIAAAAGQSAGKSPASYIASGSARPAGRR